MLKVTNNPPLTGFDPHFDDLEWTLDWASIPVIQPVPGDYGSFTIKAWGMDEAKIGDRTFRLDTTLPVRGLVMNDGTLWMSDVPQERLMMYNNARQSRGRVLIGGMGLGLYAQYALPYVDSMTIVEADSLILNIISPLVRIAAQAADVSVSTRRGDIADFLSASPDERYDTIFLDTWDTIDAAILPQVNGLRDMAIKHLAPGGQVLLWGYGWMLSLFETACRALLTPQPEVRLEWLVNTTQSRPDVRKLLTPVLDHFAGQVIEDMDAALDWCRGYAIRVVEG